MANPDVPQLETNDTITVDDPALSKTKELKSQASIGGINENYSFNRYNFFFCYKAM